MRSRKIPGRSLGWQDQDIASLPYARFFNRSIAPLHQAAIDALAIGPIAEEYFPPLAASPASLLGDAPVVENGFCFAADGSMRVAERTEMHGVTPEMVDWWFGWHSDSPDRYKMWFPPAHVHACWLADPPATARGRARYLDHTSIVDEYLGSNMVRAAIRFISPQSLGYHDPALADPQAATMICARTGLADMPVDLGYLVHQVRRTDYGCEMRSRFWLGGPYVSGRGGLAGAVLGKLAPLAATLTESDARALLVHCAQEMRHLADFLPALHAACKDS